MECGHLLCGAHTRSAQLHLCTARTHWHTHSQEEIIKPGCPPWWWWWWWWEAEGAGRNPHISSVCPVSPSCSLCFLVAKSCVKPSRAKQTQNAHGGGGKGKEEEEEGKASNLLDPHVQVGGGEKYVEEMEGWREKSGCSPFLSSSLLCLSVAPKSV